MARSFQPDRLLATLSQRGVEFVVIGGVGATLHGSPLRTADTDVCPARTPDNLVRLASALSEINARIRTVDTPDGLRFACDATFLARVDLLNLVTDFGDLDICFVPAGTAGYTELASRAERFDLDGIIVTVASLADIIHSKESANRPKDRSALPTLRALLSRSRAK
jgi:predicted nucleotidyltransferase